MIKRKIILFCFLFITSFQFSYAGSICDGWYKDFNKSVFSEICKTWVERESLSWLTSLSGSYLNMGLWYWWNKYYTKDVSELKFVLPVWYFWTNFLKENAWEIKFNEKSIWYFGNNFSYQKRGDIIYNTPTWFFGAKNSKELIYSWTLNQTPIWFFWTYKWKELIFPKLIKLIQEKTTSRAIIKNNNCTKPIIPADLNISLQNNGFSDYISISWDQVGTDTNIIIKKVSSPSEDFVIEKWANVFEDYDIVSWGTNMYFLVVSNNCSSVIYSDLLKIKYDKIEEEIDKWNISNREALLALYWTWISEQELWNKYYFSDEITDLENNLNYWSLSFFLANYKTDIKINSSKLTFDLSKYLRIFPKHVWIKTKVNKWEFERIFELINSREDFEKDIFDNIDNVFSPSIEDVYYDIDLLYNVNKKLQVLKIKNKINYELIKKCFLSSGCSDIWKYYKFIEQIKNEYNKNEHTALWISFDTNTILDYKMYFKILFTVFSKRGYYDWGYIKSEYLKYIWILVDSISMWESWSDELVWFLSYNRMSYMILDNDDFQKNLELMTKKYLKEINSLYNKMRDKTKLFEVIRDYIMK